MLLNIGNTAVQLIRIVIIFNNKECIKKYFNLILVSLGTLKMYLLKYFENMIPFQIKIISAI